MFAVRYSFKIKFHNSRDNTGMESCIPLGHSDPSIAQITIPNTPTVGQTE